MAQNVTIAGAAYSAVPAVDLPKTGGGSARFVDTSDANATANKIIRGYSGYVNGSKVNGSVGTYDGISGGTLCNYIVSNGSQYIDTGWVHKSNSTIVLDCNIAKNTRDTYLALFGSMNPSASNNAWVFFSRFAGNDIPALTRTGNETQSGTLVYGKRITIIANKSQASWTTGSETGAGIGTVTCSGTPDDGVQSMTLFAIQEGAGTYRRQSVMYLYGAKFYTGDTLEMDFVPAHINNVYGLWDRIGRAFYPSSSGSDFNGG